MPNGHLRSKSRKLLKVEGQSEGGVRAEWGPGSPPKWKREPRQLCPQEAGAREERGRGEVAGPPPLSIL